MEEILLKDICDLDNGYAFKSDDYVEASDTLNCRMSNIRPDGTFDILYSAKYLPNEFAEKYDDYLLNDGDLIIAMTDMAGDPKILGVPTVVDTKGYKLLLNQRVGKLRFIKPGVNADYLKLALQSKRVREYLKRCAGGGVQLNVSKKDILNAPVRMRTEEEQDYIAGLFRRILEIKKQREQELLCLDNLIKARFVEMFGDPTTNSMGWKTKRFDTICENLDSQRRPIAAAEREAGIYPYYGASGIVDYVVDYIFDEDILLVSEDGANLLMRSTPIAFSVNGKVWVNNHAHVVRFKDMGLQKFVEIYISMIDISDQITGSAQPKLNQAKLNAMMIPVPDKDKTDRFLEFLQQIEKSKVVVQKALDEAQLLFDSLLQKYFG